jgi:hypothetical protein
MHKPPVQIERGQCGASVAGRPARIVSALDARQRHADPPRYVSCIDALSPMVINTESESQWQAWGI